MPLCAFDECIAPAIAPHVVHISLCTVALFSKLLYKLSEELEILANNCVWHGELQCSSEL
eukprot:scaffold907_cov55-Attheya_sp.AAC.9